MNRKERGPLIKRLVITVLLLINIASVVALLLSYSSIFISPEKWWVPAFAGLAYPYIILGNLLFVLIWIFVKRKYLWLSLAVALAGFPIGSRYLQLNNTHEYEKNSRQLKILTYNVRLFDFTQQYGRENDDKLTRFTSLFKRTDADIICLQEAFIKNRFSELIPEELASRLDMQSFAYKAYAEGWTGGLIILSKHKIIKQDKVTDGDKSIALFADIILNGDTVRIFNFHLQSINLGNEDHVVNGFNQDFYKDSLFIAGSRRIAGKLKGAFIARSRQVKILREQIDESPYPLILAGDLNDPPCSYAYQKIKRGFNDAFKSAGKGMGRTYHGKYPSFRIDYILCSEEFRIHTYTREEMGLSDHHPVHSVLELKED